MSMLSSPRTCDLWGYMAKGITVARTGQSWCNHKDPQESETCDCGEPKTQQLDKHSASCSCLILEEGPRVKDSGWPLDAGKGKETVSPRKKQSCLHLGFSPVRLVSDLWPSELSTKFTVTWESSMREPGHPLRQDVKSTAVERYTWHVWVKCLTRCVAQELLIGNYFYNV